MYIEFLSACSAFKLFFFGKTLIVHFEIIKHYFCHFKYFIPQRYNLQTIVAYLELSKFLAMLFVMSQTLNGSHKVFKSINFKTE